MMTHETLTLRELRHADVAQARRILDTSEYVHYRFSPDDLGRLIELYPGVGAFSGAQGALGRMMGGSLQAFAQVNEMAPPCAWIGGFGVTWSQGERYRDYLGLLLPPLKQALLARDTYHLYYSGADYDSDWLREPLEGLGFSLTSMLRSYDKSDYWIPSEGNQRIVVSRWLSWRSSASIRCGVTTPAPSWRRRASTPTSSSRRMSRVSSATSSTSWT
jgi:ribosomal-protein-alanine N-acetyltransferase